jgi:radical SAM superfamily enzyme YgiQ (UPF0313 family)
MMVKLDPEGLEIPALGSFGSQEKHTAVPVELPELLLLQELSLGSRHLLHAIRDVGRQGVDQDRLERFASRLADRGLLVNPALDRPDPGLAAHPADADPAPRTPGMSVAVATPRFFRIGRGRFEDIDHDGRLRAVFSARELAAVACLRRPASAAECLSAHRTACGALALDEPSFAAVLDRLEGAGALIVSERDQASGGRAVRRGWGASNRAEENDRDWQRFQRIRAMLSERGEVSEGAERRREEHTGRGRVRVVPVQQNGTIAPLALGMIVAAAKAYDGGRLEDHYVFHPDWLMRPSKVRALAPRPSVYLISNYNWSHRHNLMVSRTAKQLSRGSITIHGGPNTPSYVADEEAYFRDNPHVDVTVRGEGELAVVEILDALAGSISDEPPDLSVLHDIPGISFRDGDSIVRTPDSERIDDLDALPSPFLTGLFDDYAGSRIGIIETNRGCPFRCTFCDWGSATGSRNRRFSLERVFAELEWLASNEVLAVQCADANFGFLERDVEIARKVTELKRESGYPKSFNYTGAKNTTKHLKPIMQILSQAGVLINGTIGVQSTDPNTLKAVRRTNIKLEKYDELAAEFRRSRLSLSVDMMLGLPGQTVASFRNDLQGCIDRGVFPRIFITELLVNSPMNEPAYRAENEIEAELTPDGMQRLVVATSTFTREDYEEMSQLRLFFELADVVGLLRHVAHFVRSETGAREIDFYERLRRDIRDDPERWPILAFLLRASPRLLGPPGSWHLPLVEAHRYVVEVLGLADDEALRTVLAVQRAVLPARNRPMPQTSELRHDYAVWHRTMVETRDAGHHDDWHSIVPPLRELGPGSFTVDDPDRICEFGVGSAIEGDFFGSFELRTPVERWPHPEPEPERVRASA